MNRCPMCGRPLDAGQVIAIVDTYDLDALALDLDARVFLVAFSDMEPTPAACVHTTEQELRG